MQREIWLIRHAQSTANRDHIIQGQGVLDTELTEKGIWQANLVADYLWNNQKTLQGIYASDLQRAKQTAEQIGRVFNLEVQLEKDLREAHFGKWEGRLKSEASAEDPATFERWQNERTWRPPWCESFKDLQKRALQILKYILHNSSGNLAIVSHGGLIAALVPALTEQFGEHPSSHNCGMTKLICQDHNIQVTEFDFLVPGLVAEQGFEK